MGRFPSVLQINPEDYRRLHVLQQIRQRIEQATQAKLDIQFYDPATDGSAIGEAPVNPAFVLCEVTWRWWGGTVPYRHRRIICAFELENWDSIDLCFWRVFDQRWTKIVNELAVPLAHGG